jgi:hypothetical protein
MKHFKNLLFLSILCSPVLFTNCGNSDDPVTDNDTNITNEDNTTKFQYLGFRMTIFL